jgi:hypothetical protein
VRRFTLTQALAALCVVSACSAVWLGRRSDGPEPDGYGHDVLFLDAERIVVAEWHSRAGVSSNGGRSWVIVDMHAPIRELTVGPDGTVWGLYRWHGIHEPPSACFVTSRDAGLTWNRIELDPRALFPECFISPRGSEPMVVASDGQVWAHVPGASGAFDGWARVGTRNPDRDASAGIATPAAIYVASRQNTWLSTDRGATWMRVSLADARCFAATRTHVYAIDRAGAVWRTALGANDWSAFARVSAADIPFAFAARDDTLYVAAEGAGWKAAAFRIDPDGSVHELTGLEGKQCYSARIAPDGRAWFVAQGLYVEEAGEHVPEGVAVKGRPRRGTWDVGRGTWDYLAGVRATRNPSPESGFCACIPERAAAR